MESQSAKPNVHLLPSGLSQELSETDRMVLYRCQPVIDDIITRIAAKRRKAAMDAVATPGEAIDTDFAVQEWQFQAVCEAFRRELRTMAKVPAQATR